LTKRPSLDEVQRFHAAFVLSTEGARIFSPGAKINDCNAATTLSLSGIEPAHSMTYKKKRVWRRSDVERLARTSTVG